MAKESIVTDFSSPDFPKEIEIIPLPGHFFDMVGFRSPDNTVFIADCVSSTATLSKYGVTFIYDIAAYLDTLAKIETDRKSLKLNRQLKQYASYRKTQMVSSVKYSGRLA